MEVNIKFCDKKSNFLFFYRNLNLKLKFIYENVCYCKFKARFPQNESYLPLTKAVQLSRICAIVLLRICSSKQLLCLKHGTFPSSAF